MTKNCWNKVNVVPSTIFDLINENFIEMGKSYPDSLPNFSNSSTIIATSDYGGEHSDSKYIVYSFLLVDSVSVTEWEIKRNELRKLYLTENRRISFKGLGDIQKQNILMPFLNSVNYMNGISFTVAIHKEISSIFDKGTPINLNNPDFIEFKKWKKGVLEKASRIVHILSLLCSGLLKDKQNLLWFSDQDSIAANNNRVIHLTNLFSWIISMYLNINLGHIKCGTTNCDDGSRVIEDLTAIPDLISGTVCEQLNITNSDKSNFSNTVFYMHRGDFNEKISKITWWYSNSKATLKRYLCIVDNNPHSLKHRVSWFHFYDQK